MKRRNFIAMLAGVPLIGRLFGSPDAPSDAGPVKVVTNAKPVSFTAESTGFHYLTPVYENGVVWMDIQCPSGRIIRVHPDNISTTP